MKMSSLPAVTRPVAVFFGYRENAMKFGLFYSQRTASCRSAEKGHGFTLVEMLVVVTIIGILASLITAAAVAARRRAKIAAIVMEISQLDMACKAYKERFGEYPPDFSPGAATTTADEVLSHLTRAFPKYVPGITTNFSSVGMAGLREDVKAGWKIDIGNLTTSPVYNASPAMALTFWLGGMPNWVSVPTSYPKTNCIKGFNGFSANPLNPFDNSANRIGPFYEFNPTQVVFASTCDGIGQLYYYPNGIFDIAGKCPLLYFRAVGGSYTRTGHPSLIKYCYLTKCNSSNYFFYPAWDTRASNWVNPQSCQIFCSGMDLLYNTQAVNSKITDASPGYVKFPDGSNYGPYSLDDITNFSNGTLEDAIP